MTSASISAQPDFAQELLRLHADIYPERYAPVPVLEWDAGTIEWVAGRVESLVKGLPGYAPPSNDEWAIAIAVQSDDGRIESSVPLDFSGREAPDTIRAAERGLAEMGLDLDSADVADGLGGIEERLGSWLGSCEDGDAEEAGKPLEFEFAGVTVTISAKPAS